MNLRMLPGHWMKKPIEHRTRLQHHPLRNNQRRQTTCVPRGGKRSAKAILSNTDHAVSESFHQKAGDLLSQHLAARPPLVTADAHPKVLALHALVDEITKQMTPLPLKRRLSFFRSSVAIVAEVLAAMYREAPAHRAVPGASADDRRIRRQSLGRFHRGFQNGFECLWETYSGDSPKAGTVSPYVKLIWYALCG